MSEYTNNSEFAENCREKATLIAELKGIEGQNFDRIRELQAILNGRLAGYPSLSPSRLRMLERPDGDAIVKRAVGYSE